MTRARELVLTAACCLLTCNYALAAVTADEAAALKTTLTPMGAEKAGNKEGSIPAWDGGVTKGPANYKQGDPRPDPFPGEQPLFSVTAANMAQHESKLSEGVKAMLKKYPNTFRLDVYPTHRTAGAPQWVYDNTFKNATRAKVTAEGFVEGAYGGIPFPIPKSGAEAIWNHRLQFTGEGSSMAGMGVIGLPDGKVIQGVQGTDLHLRNYYASKGTLESFDGGMDFARVWVMAPAFQAGQQFTVHDFTNKPRQSWQYLTGQRRIRKAPSICCDAPDEINSGINYWDESFVFQGDLDRFDWEIVGKKELYIPYNNGKIFQPGLTLNQMGLSHHLNPDLVRWELHRVWVVEAKLASGKRHVIPKRRFYLDEDTWGAVLSDGYDSEGKLWRMGLALPMLVPDGPYVVPNMAWGVYNILQGSYMMTQLPDYAFHKRFYKALTRQEIDPNRVMPDAMAGEASR